MAETSEKVDAEAQATPDAPDETAVSEPSVDEVSVKLSPDYVKLLSDIGAEGGTQTVAAGSFPEVQLHEKKNTRVPADYAAALVDAGIAVQVND